MRTLPACHRARGRVAPIRFGVAQGRRRAAPLRARNGTASRSGPLVSFLPRDGPPPGPASPPIGSGSRGLLRPSKACMALSLACLRLAMRAGRLFRSRLHPGGACCPVAPHQRPQAAARHPPRRAPRLPDRQQPDGVPPPGRARALDSCTAGHSAGCGGRVSALLNHQRRAFAAALGRALAAAVWAELTDGSDARRRSLAP